MNNIELREELPESYLEKAAEEGIYEKKLRGDLKSSPHSERIDIRIEAERVVNYTREIVFPKILP